MHSKPSISVVFPCYNAANYLKEAIDSILQQSYPNFELIIIDDKSTDNTIEIIDSYSDERIILIKKEQNGGLVDSLNLGVKHSKHDLIAIMHADDIAHHQRFEKQVQAFEADSKLVCCGTYYQIIGENTNKGKVSYWGDVHVAMFEYDPLGHPTVMFKKNVLIENGLSYRQEFYGAEDYDLWANLIRYGRVKNIPEVCLYYRQHANQISKIKIQQITEYTDKIRYNLLQSLVPEHDFQPFIIDYQFEIIQCYDNKWLKKEFNVLNQISKKAQNQFVIEVAVFENYITRKKYKLLDNYFKNQNWGKLKFMFSQSDLLIKSIKSRIR
jgi:glycosyltransferase involved in cell wall biosynthesis